MTRDDTTAAHVLVKRHGRSRQPAAGVLYDALASEAMGTLTTGVFLVGFAMALGAATAPSAHGQLQSVGRSSSPTQRFHFLVQAIGIVTLILCVALHQAMAAIAGCAWNS